MAKVEEKELINLRLKLKLVREEIKQRSKTASMNERGLKKVLEAERKLMDRIKTKESRGE